MNYHHMKKKKSNMHIDMKYFQFHSWRHEGYYFGSGCWFRILGIGLRFTNGVLTFNERHGHKKYMKLPFGYRVTILRKSGI